jgi:pyruvate kinase
MELIERWFELEVTRNPFQKSRRLRHTKTVATVGPACAEEAQLEELVRAGVDVFRINTAHGSRIEHETIVERVRAVSGRVGRPVAILVDLAGPKIRLGHLGAAEVTCDAGARVRFIRGDSTSTPTDLVTTYAPLIDELDVGRRVMLADGSVALEVESIDGESAVCRVVQPGTIRSGQGVNLPGLELSVPTMNEADRANAAWAARSGVDFIGMSFVRSSDDVRELVSLIRSEGSETHVIAKIEKPEALEDIGAIVRVADGIMIARGDLGVEIDIAQVPVTQKRIITLCRRHHKPVIVATQMLDSMQRSPVPTRAEATDVANAILDGADACMLSGETAIGKYPREAVEMMCRIAVATEKQFNLECACNTEGAGSIGVADVADITHGVADAAGRLAESVNARVIIVASNTGATARTVSNSRHLIPTVGVSESDATLRRMCLYWGVRPLAGCPTDDPAGIFDYVVARARVAGYLTTGDRVVMIAGTGLRVSTHNLIVVYELE